MLEKRGCGSDLASAGCGTWRHALRRPRWAAAVRLALLVALVCGAVAAIGSERVTARNPEWFNCPTTDLGTLSTTISRSGQWTDSDPCAGVLTEAAPHFYRFRLAERSLITATTTADIEHGIVSFNREESKHGRGSSDDGGFSEVKVLDAGQWRILITPLGSPFDDRTTGSYTLRLRRQSAPPALRFATEPRDLQFVLGTRIAPMTFPIATGGYGQLTYETASEDNVFGNPPPGLRFDRTTRRLTGTPEGTSRVFKVTYQVRDESGETANRPFTIEYVTTTPPPPSDQCERNASQVRDGGLIREAGTLDVYVVKRVAGRQWKRPVLSWNVMNAYGWDETDVTNVCAGVLQGFTTSMLARLDTADPVYYLRQTGQDSGQRHWLDVTAEQFDAASLDWNAVFRINIAEYNIWSKGDDYGCEDLGRIPGADPVPSSLCGNRPETEPEQEPEPEECPGGMLQTEDGCEEIDDDDSDLEFAWSETDQRWQLGRRVSLTLPPVETTGRVTYRLQHRFRNGAFDFSLPAGLSFNPQTRRLSGTLSPADVLGDSHRFRYTATDGTGATATMEFGADIRLPADFRWTDDDEIPNQSWTIGEEIEPLQLPSARSGAGRVTYSIRWERQGVQSEGAPPGMSFNAGTRTLSGTPRGAPGPFTIFYRATEPTGVYRQIEIGAEFSPLPVSNVCGDPTVLAVAANPDTAREVSKRDEITSDDCRIQYAGSRSLHARAAVQYAFTLEQRSRISFEMFASTLDPHLILADATGRYHYLVGTAATGGRWLNLPGSKMADNDRSAVIASAGASDDLGIATIGQTLPAGQYWLFATSSGSSITGAFRLNYSFETLPEAAQVPLEIAEQIARRFAPTLHFQQGERYFPVAVDLMLNASSMNMRELDGRPAVAAAGGAYGRVAQLLEDLIDAGADHRFGTRSSYLDWHDDASTTDHAQSSPSTIYAVVEQTENSTILRYWFFYLFNDALGGADTSDTLGQLIEDGVGRIVSDIASGTVDEIADSLDQLTGTSLASIITDAGTSLVEKSGEAVGRVLGAIPDFISGVEEGTDYISALYDHEGDWEGIQIEFNGSPREVLDGTADVHAIGFAAHEGGRVWKGGVNCWGDGGPDVYVAKGSHASYPTTGRFSLKKDTSIYERLDRPATQFDFENGDYTLQMITGSEWWFNWAGRWGYDRGSLDSRGGFVQKLGEKLDEILNTGSGRAPTGPGPSTKEFKAKPHADYSPSDLLDNNNLWHAAPNPCP